MEQYVKGFKGFTPVKMCGLSPLASFYFIILLLLLSFLLSLLLLSMMTLITGFTCPPTIYFKFITKCDKCYYKVRQLFLLQSATAFLLQSATSVITKCDRYYKV